MTNTTFTPDSIASFAEAYPETPNKLRHDLCDHPLLQLPALVELATQLRSDHVEYNQGDLPIGINPKDVLQLARGDDDTRCRYKTRDYGMG